MSAIDSTIQALKPQAPTIICSLRQSSAPSELNRLDNNDSDILSKGKENCQVIISASQIKEEKGIHSTQGGNESASSSSKKRRTSSPVSLCDPLPRVKQDFDESMSQSFSRKRFLTDNQRSILTELFAETNFPDMNATREICSVVGLEPKQVQSWFQNMRRKEKKSGTYQVRSMLKKPSHTFRNKNVTIKTEMMDIGAVPNLSSSASVKTNNISSKQTNSDARATSQAIYSETTNSQKLFDFSFEDSAASKSFGDSGDNLLIDFMQQAERLKRSLSLPLFTNKTSSFPSKYAEEMQKSEVNLPAKVSNVKTKTNEVSEVAILKDQIKDLESNMGDLCNLEKIKIDCPEVAILKEQIKNLERNQANLMSNNTGLTIVVTQLRAQIKDLERNQGQLISKNTDLNKKSSTLEEKASSVMKNQLSEIAYLKSKIALLNRQHTIDVKTIDETKDAITNMSDKLQIKNEELSQAKLSHEVNQLELNKLKSSAHNEQLNSSQADLFQQIRRTLKLTLENDSKFCKIEEVEELSDFDVLEYINSILFEFKGVKKRNFVEVSNCISQFEKFQVKKDKYKKRKQKLMNEIEDLKSSCEQKDSMLLEKKRKFKVVKQQLKDKMKTLEEGTIPKDVEELQKQAEENEIKFDSMLLNQVNLEEQIDTQNTEIKHMPELEKEKDMQLPTL